MEEGPEKEAKLAVLSELEKRKKKALKSIKSSEKKIRKAESSIRKSERAIPKNDDNQEMIKDRLDQQEIVVQSYIDKLNTIKNY
jgi:chromosome segregation ATPase